MRMMTVHNVIERIVGNRARYEARNKKKGKTEAAYHRDKTYVSEM